MVWCMSGFDKRSKKGEVHEKDLMDYLDKIGISYLMSGYENWISQNRGFENIRFNSSNTSIFVRHFPDITMTTNYDTYLLEAKNSTGIERQCWNAYRSIYDNLGVKVIFYLKDKRIYPIQNIVFKNVDSYCPLSKMNVPVEDGIWRCPSKLSHDRYYEYKKKMHYRTSGNTYALIDFKKSKGYDRSILKRLSK